MKTNTLTTMMLIIFFNLSYQFAQAQCHIDDWTALKALYESTGGDNWKNNEGWEIVKGNSTKPDCNLATLYGIEMKNERVSKIKLYKNNLVGMLPTEITNLTSLEYLTFYENELIGSIPPKINNLINLKELHLTNNNLTGDIPFEKLISLPKLNYLYLNVNNFTGTITKEIVCKPSLIKLSLSDNNLKGEIPICENTGTESQLIELFMNENQLTGSIPPEINHFKNLIKLGLADNQLDGEIPTTLSELNQLERLFLQNNLLTGNIPNELTQLNNLKILFLNENNLSGSIPENIGHIDSLEQLWVSNNALSGSIPNSIGNLSKLWFLYLSNNLFTGELPESICQLNHLKKLGLSYNYFSGTIPNCLGEINSLEQLWLGNNNFEGEIPLSILQEGVRMSIAKNYFNCDEVSAFTSNNQFPNIPIDYAPQRYSSNESGVDSHLRDTLTQITLQAPLPWSASGTITYQWYHNGENLLNANQATYSIASIQPEDAGVYNLYVKLKNCASNSTYTEFISDPVMLHVKDHDLNGNPIDGYTQLVVEFDNKTNKENFERPLLRSGVKWKDKCDCNRELHLYEFSGDVNSESDFQKTYMALSESINSRWRKTDGFRGGLNYSLNNVEVDENPGSAYSVTYDYETDMYEDVSITYILDSGLDRTNYPDASQYLLSTAPENCFNLSATGYNFSTPYECMEEDIVSIDDNYQDNYWHGTFGFRVISEGLTNASNAKIVPIKSNDIKNGSVFDMICALYHAIDNNADVINMSAGHNGVPMSILEDAIYEAKRKGIFIIAAAGNSIKGLNIDYNDSKVYPASFVNKEREILNEDGSIEIITYDNLISVAAVDHEGNLADFSNYGKESVTLAAPGVNIAGYGLANAVQVKSGTSQATFFVSQVLAREIARDNSRSLAEVRAHFEASYLEDQETLTEYTITGKKIPFNWEAIDIMGCTDPTACNFNRTANKNDGNCKYCNTADCPECPPDACPPCPDLCSNGILDDGEDQIDCGGACVDCTIGLDPPAIFLEYPFLNDLVDYNNCEKTGIALFDFGNYIFALVETNDGTNLYSDYYDGVFCYGSSCADLYNLNNPTISWTCGGSSSSLIDGCTDFKACNFNAEATIDDGSCDYGNSICDDPCNESNCDDAPNNCPNPCDEYPFLQQFIDCDHMNSLKIQVYDYGNYVFALVESNTGAVGYTDYYDGEFCIEEACSIYTKPTGPDMSYPCENISSAPTCEDGIQNGTETDIDCGGSACAPCEPSPSGGEPTIFSTYPFINNFASYDNCNGISIQVFDFGNYAFALIKTQSETTMYSDFYDGIYCSGNDCAGQFSLTNTAMSWSCGQSFNKAQSYQTGTENKMMPSFSVYPNPATDHINVKVLNDTTSGNTFVLYDISGQKIKEETFYGNHNTLNLSDLPKGMYIVELQNDLFKSTQKVLVK